MKSFASVKFDYGLAVSAVAEFERLLTTNDALGESKHILPLFRGLPQLCHMCHAASKTLAAGDLDRYATEFDLFGDFVCDLAIGNWDGSLFTFVEFEDAIPSSIFEKKGGRATREWGKRFDHGYSQLIDWFHKLAKMAEHPDFEAKFGKRTIRFDGLLVIGREKGLALPELQRLEWRSEHVVVHSQKITCVTYDGLLRMMKKRLETLDTLRKALA